MITFSADSQVYKLLSYDFYFNFLDFIPYCTSMLGLPWFWTW